jgi:hypothetical protein
VIVLVAPPCPDEEIGFRDPLSALVVGHSVERDPRAVRRILRTPVALQPRGIGDHLPIGAARLHRRDHGLPARAVLHYRQRRATPVDRRPDVSRSRGCVNKPPARSVRVHPIDVARTSGGPVQAVEVHRLRVRREDGSSFQTAPVVVVSCLSPVPPAETRKIWTVFVPPSTASNAMTPFCPGKLPQAGLGPPAIAATNCCEHQQPRRDRCHGDSYSDLRHASRRRGRAQMTVGSRDRALASGQRGPPVDLARQPPQTAANARLTRYRPGRRHPPPLRGAVSTRSAGKAPRARERAPQARDGDRTPLSRAAGPGFR